MIFLVFLFCIILSGLHGQTSCPLAGYVGYVGDISMVSHQARGIIEISNTDCSFKVSKLEVAGFEGLQWWGAKELDLDSLINGVSLGGEDQLNSDLFQVDTQVTISDDKWQALQSMKVIALWIPEEGRLVGYTVLGSFERAPTMFDFCIKHTETSQLRWSIEIAANADNSFGRFAIEGQIAENVYHAIGFPAPGARNRVMGGSDSIVYGLLDGEPFSLDYYLKNYFECTEVAGVYVGVCRDSQLGDVQSNVNMTYWHDIEGTQLISAQRYLISPDKEFDQDINPYDPLVFHWASASFSLDDDNLPYLLYHGLSYGEPLLTLIDGSSPEELPQCGLIYDSLAISSGSVHLIDDISQPLTISIGPKKSINPLQGDQVLYVNGLPQPTILVSGGDQLQLQIEQGINVVITDSPFGGQYAQAATKYAEGVGEITWSVEGISSQSLYYQSLDDPLIGGKILLRDLQSLEAPEGQEQEYGFRADWQDLIVLWNVDGEMISWSVEATKPAGWICIGFGTRMRGGYAYVGWIDDNAQGMLEGYWMTGQDADDVILDENADISDAVVERDGITNRLKMTFRQPFVTSSEKKPDLEAGEVSMLYAHGATWRRQGLLSSDIHSVRGVDLVNLLSGETKAPKVDNVWIIHGVLMFIGWFVFVPAAIMVARFFKKELGPWWIQIHKILNISGLVVSFIAALLAFLEMNEKGSEHFEATHTKLGLAVTIIGIYQGIQGFIRPPKPGPNAKRSEKVKRNVWGFPHVIVGFSLIILSTAAIITGLQILQDNIPGAGDTWKWEVSVFVWLGLLVLVALVLTLYRAYDSDDDVAPKQGQFVFTSSFAPSGSVEMSALPLS